MSSKRPFSGAIACIIALALLIISAALSLAQMPAAPADCSAQALQSTGTVYYVSPTGSNSNSGTSPCFPWQTMAKANAADVQPGQTVAFQGGQSFSQSFSPWGGDGGSAEAPVTYTSYGTGNANLTSGIFLENRSYLVISDLNISSNVSRGIGTASNLDAGSIGVTNVLVTNDAISSAYDAGEGGYGIGLENPADSDWTIQDSNIENTADSGILTEGSYTTIDNDVFENNGIGSHCGNDPTTGWASTTNNPCHGIYEKSSNSDIYNNQFTESASDNPYISTYSAITLRGHDNTVTGNTITGGDNGINYWEESTIPGTTYIGSNIIGNQLQTALETGAGTQPLVESFTIQKNIITNPGGYGAFFYPPLGRATLTLTGNVFTVSPSSAYLNLANAPMTAPPGLSSNATNPYTASTFVELQNTFTGTNLTNPWFIAGVGYDWADYRNVLGVDSEGLDDIESAPLAPVSPVAGTPPVTLVYPPPEGHSAVAPHNTGLPRVTGKFVIGDKLTLSTGQWSGTQLSYSYAWKLCNKQGKACHSIPSATKHTFVLKHQDLGHRLKGVVKATNSAGSTSALSLVTARVMAPTSGRKK